MNEIETQSTELAVFDEVAVIIAKYKAENESLAFDYEDKEGAKQAKSHISKLRKVKGKISEVHKDAKAEALAFGRRLDAKKNEYSGEVDIMIKVHKDPLDVIEAKVIEEATRKAREYADTEFRRIAEIDKAHEARERAIILAEEKIAREKDEAKEKVRREAAEAADRVIKEQQEKIKRAEEENRRIVEEAAKARAKLQEEAEKSRIQAEEKANAESEAEEERLAEIAAEMAIEANRIANKKHRKKIEDEVHIGLTKTGHLGNVEASEVLEAIKQNKIPHIVIQY